MRKIAIPLLLLFSFLCGCGAPSSADDLMQKHIDQKERISIATKDGAGAEELETLRNELERINEQLRQKRAAMSKVKWNKLVAKYHLSDAAAFDNMLTGASAGDQKNSGSAESE